MLAEFTSVLETVPGAFLAEGPQKPPHPTVTLQETRPQAGCGGLAICEALQRSDRKKRGVCVRTGRRELGERKQALPSILSEKIVFKITKFLSNPFLFFSHFLKVFQEFRSKKGRKILRKLG